MSLYYLNQRYYNPEWGRFINSDTLIGLQGDINGHNAFASCQNNPINYEDPSGEFFFTALGGLIGGIAGGISAAVQGKDVRAGIIGGAVQGAIMGAATDIIVATGGVAAVGVGVAIAIYAGTGFVGGYIGNATEQVVTNVNKGSTVQDAIKKVDHNEAAVNGAVGLVSNVAGLGVGNVLDDVFVQPLRESIKEAATLYAHNLTNDFSYMNIRAMVAKMTRIELLSGTMINITANSIAQSSKKEQLVRLGIY